MKRLFLTLSLFTALCATSQAQILPSFEFGVKGALNFTKLKSEGNYLSSHNRAGYQAGAYARVGVLGFHLQPEVYVTGKNLEVDFENATTGNTENIKFTAVDVPVLIGKRFGLGPLGVRVNTGPVFTFNLKKNKNNDESLNFDGLRNIKKNNTAWAFGLGADVSRLRVDVRYELGMSTITKSDISAQKLNLWSVGVGYRIF